MEKRIALRVVLAILAAGLLVSPAWAGPGCKMYAKLTKPESEHKVVKVEVETGGAWLGVTIQDLDESLREAMDIDEDAEGVLVGDVVEDSPAEKAGIVKGDIILLVDDESIVDVSQLVDEIKSREPDTKAEITVLRDGKKKTLGAVLGSRPEKLMTLGSLFDLEALKGLEHIEIPQINIGISGWGGRGRLGVYVDDLSEGLAEYFGVPDGKGVLVEDVVDDSPAEKAGIKAGDVILEIDGERIYDTEGLVEEIREMEADEETPIVVLRKGKKITLKATVSEPEYDESTKKFIQEFQKKYKGKVGDYEDAIILHKMGEADYEEEMDELEEELEELRQELKELRHELKEELQELKSK
jgi:C-terminal processing protease CtpA/Prc